MINNTEIIAKINQIIILHDWLLIDEHMIQNHFWNMTDNMVF